MKAALVVTGDELITGAVVDENSAFISDLLLAAGIPTVLHLVVGDDLPAIVDALRVAGERAEAVIVTGGLGPTDDDLNREAACRLAGVDKVVHPAALERLREVFRMIGREMSENNLRQAEIPRGAELIPNPVGTAPGFSLAVNRTVYHFVPGVPAECRLMMEETVRPRLLRQAGARRFFTTRLFRTFGLAESALSQRLAGVEWPPGVRLGYRALFPEIHLKLMAEAEEEAAAVGALEQAAEKVREMVGEVIYSEDGRSLEAVVLDLLRERRKRLAVAESCTGGLITKRLTDIPGSSEVLEAGFITYSNQAKSRMLGIDPGLLAAHGAVSAEVAVAMARGAKKFSGAHLALAVTGIAGPGGGTEQKPVGTVFISLADEGGEWTDRFLFRRAQRAFIRELTAQAGLEIIRRRILGLPESLK